MTLFDLERSFITYGKRNEQPQQRLMSVRFTT